VKIIISAYTCSPEKGSERGSGWNIDTQMAQHHAVGVVTRTDNRLDIDKVYIPSVFPRLHFTYFDLPILSRLTKPRRLFNQVYYYLWHVFIYFFAIQLHRQHQFDLAHHITWGRYWMPNSASFLPLPFIFGPVAGGETIPSAFIKNFTWRSWLFQTLRKGVRWAGEHDPLVRATIKKSKFVLTASEQTFKRVESLGPSMNIFSGPQVGMNQQEMDRLGKLSLPCELPFRLISIGRLLHWKGVHLGLQAFALSKLEDSEFLIVGDGPEKHSLQRLATRLEVADRVKFLGWIPREEGWKLLEQSHVLLHPCLHGLVTTAYLEAMAARRPVISVEVNSKAQIQFSHEMGVKIIDSSPKSMGENMATAITELSANRILRKQIGEREREYVANKFMWDKKVATLESLYRKVGKVRSGNLVICDGKDVFTPLT